MPDKFKPVILINNGGIRFTAYTKDQLKDALDKGGYQIAPDSELQQSRIDKTIAREETELFGHPSRESRRS